MTPISLFLNLYSAWVPAELNARGGKIIDMTDRALQPDPLGSFAAP